MTNQPEPFFATVFYTDKDGGNHTIMGLVMAVSVDDAMHAALDAVSSLSACAQIVGGVIEPADADLLAAFASEEGPNARAPQRAYRAPGTTVH